MRNSPKIVFMKQELQSLLSDAVHASVVTGEEPCLRKVQYSRMYELPMDAALIRHEMNHELLVSKVISGLNGEIYVNYRIEKELERMKLIGYIDILNINSGSKLIIEVKTGKEKESHHVQLLVYMDCFDDARGILRYPDTRYTYFSENIPENLWEMVSERLKPLLSDRLLSPLQGFHCQYCRYRSMCRNKEGIKSIDR